MGASVFREARFIGRYSKSYRSTCSKLPYLVRFSNNEFTFFPSYRVRFAESVLEASAECPSGSRAQMRSYLPDVSSRIFHHCAAIAVGHILRRFERYGSGTDRALISSIDVIDIQIEKGRHCLSGTYAAHHDI